MRKIILLIVMLITLCVSVTTNVKLQDITEQVVTSNEVKNLDVYFPRLPDFKFVGETIKLEDNISQEEKVRLIISRLIEGSNKANLIDVIPKGSKLNNVYVKGNTVFVDFSKEFVENHPGGSLGEYNTIYSIVNSLTEIDGIEQVNFLIDGQNKDAYKGHTQLDMPISRDESMIIEK